MKNMETPTILFQEWILAIIVVISTVAITTTTRALLKRLHQDRGWRVLRVLAPSVSNVLYIVGLRLFADVAPLHGKLEIWLNGSIYVLSVLIYFSLIQRAALLGVEWSALRTETSEVLHQGFIPLLRNVIMLFVFFSAAIMILKHFNYDVMSLITALGVSTFAVGLAAKETLANMISGFILIIDRNLRPGDRVNLSGTTGDVIEIGLRSTQIKIADGNTLIVPNSELVNTKIINLSVPSREITCSTSVRVPYSAPFPKVKTICLSIVGELKQVAHNRPASVNLVNLSDGYQLIQVGFWIKDLNDSGAAVSDFNEQLLEKLFKEGIPLVAAD